MPFWKKQKKRSGKRQTKKQDSISSLKRKLDRIFSKYIRLRDTRVGNDGNRYGCCISCGRIVEYSKGDAGHYVSRSRLSTRYNEHNVHFQCRKCNRFEQGRQLEHGMAIDRKYGKGYKDNLYTLSRCTSKLMPMWYQIKIDEYKEKVKGMENESHGKRQAC